MAENEEQRLDYIEETVLKKRKHSEEWAIRRRQQLLERQWKIKENKKLAFKRAEQYIAEYRSKVMTFHFNESSLQSPLIFSFQYSMVVSFVSSDTYKGKAAYFQISLNPA